MLSWACTVHRGQGLSLTAAVVSFDLKKRKSVVALSTVTSIDNLFLIGEYHCNVFKDNESVVVEFSVLREIDCNSITVSLSNKRSLKRHTADIRRLTENDILCLTENQIEMILTLQKS